MASTVTDLVDRESNIGLTFASDDVEHDSGMWEILITAIVPFCPLVLNVPLLVEAFRLLLTYMMADYSGNFVIQMSLGIMAREVGLGFLTYLVVVCLHIRAIRRVSLSLALKVQE